MIDINLIRNNQNGLEKALLKRIPSISFDEMLEWDLEKKKISQRIDNMRQNRNENSDLIKKLKDKKDDQTNKLIEEMKTLRDSIDIETEKFKDLEKKIFDFLSVLPNIPDDDLVAGGKENNTVVNMFKEKPTFNFELIPHDIICKNLNLIDYERGVKIAGTGNWIYTGLGAKFEWALINYFVDYHMKNGYTFTMIPYMLNQDCGFGAGQFPKFNNDVYWLGEKFLLPTAETALVNLHAGEILDEKDLPKVFCIFSMF